MGGGSSLFFSRLLFTLLSNLPCDDRREVDAESFSCLAASDNAMPPAERRDVSGANAIRAGSSLDAGETPSAEAATLLAESTLMRERDRDLGGAIGCEGVPCSEAENREVCTR